MHGEVAFGREVCRVASEVCAHRTSEVYHCMISEVALLAVKFFATQKGMKIIKLYHLVQNDEKHSHYRHCEPTRVGVAIWLRLRMKRFK
jgi:hypothetical protein